MKGFLDLLGVVGSGLAARKVRTLLIVLGPLIGVGAIVAAVGLTESQKGELKARLDELGTTLIVADSEASFGAESDPRFPEDIHARVGSLAPLVTGSSGVIQISGLQILPHAAAEEAFRVLPVPVLAVDSNLPAVIEVSMLSGRWIDPADETGGRRAAVIGADLAEEYAYAPGEIRSILIEEHDYAVIGVLEEFAFDPAFDTAVFIPISAAEEDFDQEPEPARIYVRSAEGETEFVADLLPDAIALGGAEETSVDVPSDALAASAEADKALRNIVILMGGLALFVGGVGIANVMSISVIQRASEIGIRRALGHSRTRIGLQFLIEALVVGLIGGVLGVLVGGGVVYLISDLRDWVPVLDWPQPFIWILPAVGISVLFGLYPSIRAARLEPLETLRLG
ncbi:MAG: ABC transporter permease [Actinomycetota bacterium]